MAVFRESELIEKISTENPDIETISYFLEKYPEIHSGIISSVADFSSEISDYLGNVLDIFLELDHRTSLPIKNRYLSPETLGYDRIAAAVGAKTLFPDDNVLVIDMGTAITIDLVSSEHEFIGGNISPGLGLRAKALHKFTRKLPLVAPKIENEIFGRTTEEAISSGIIQGIFYEIEGYINQMNLIYKKLKIVLTGGDVKYFDKKLKNSIFVDSNLNLKGLNRILDYNNG